MTKIFGIVKDNRELRKISTKIKELNLSETSPLILNLANKNIKTSYSVKNKNDYINETQLLNESADEIRKLSYNWNMISFPEIKKLATYDNIPLWECTALHFELVLRSIVSNIELIKNIIEKEKPDLFLIVNSDDLLSNTIITTLKELEAKHEIIEDDYKIKLNNKIRDKYKFIAARYFKPIVIDRYIKLKTLNKVSINDHENKKIMFFSYLNLDPQIMLPIIQELKKQNKTFLVFAMALDVQEEFAKHHIQFNTFADYGFKDNEAIKKKKKQFDEIWEILNQDKRFMYYNINLWGIIKDELYYTVFKHFYETIRLIEGIKLVIEKENIKVVIMGSDVHRLGKTVALLGNKLGLKSLVIQHGVAGILGFVPVTCTKIAVWGEASKRFLLQNNVPKEKIAITGASKFDAIKNTNYNKESILKEFNLDKNNKIILFGTQTVPEKEDMFNCVINGLSNEQLIIKLHPKDDLDFYNTMLSKLNLKNKVVVVKDYDIYKLLSITDLTISRASSTVVIESMLFNVPVITLNLANIKSSSEMINYENYECVIEVKKQDEIKKAINDILYNKKIKEKLEKNMQKFIKDYAYKIDGKSTERIITVAKNMLPPESDNQGHGSPTSRGNSSLTRISKLTPENIGIIFS